MSSTFASATGVVDLGNVRAHVHAASDIIGGVIPPDGSVTQVKISWGSTATAGYFYTGTTNPSATNRLNYNGALHVSSLASVGDVTAFSDARLKMNVQEISPAAALECVNLLRGVYYERVCDPGVRKVGVIAQEVAAVVPEVVSVHGDGEALSVAYGNLVGVLIQAVKQLSAGCDELRARVSELEGARG